MDAAAYSERGKAAARAAAAEAAAAAVKADAWLRALPTDRDVLAAARRAVLATRLVRALVDPDAELGLVTDGDLRLLAGQ